MAKKSTKRAKAVVEKPSDRPAKQDVAETGLASQNGTLPTALEGSIESENIPDRMPVLPLRDVVIYPSMIFPVLVGRESSLGAVGAAMSQQRCLFLVAQRDSLEEEPQPGTLYQFGTV